MTGIYINGNGKFQSTMNALLNRPDDIKLSETREREWQHKLKRYKEFYLNGFISAQLRTAAINRYDNIGTIEMAVANYIEEDMDNFLAKVNRAYRV